MDVNGTPTGSFRSALPDLQVGKFKEIAHHDAYSWANEFYKNLFARILTEGWLALWAKPFVGMTTDGTVRGSLYSNEDHQIPTANIVTRVNKLLAACNDEELHRLKFPINARQWRSWSNPEIYISHYGLRLDELEAEKVDLVLDILKETLSAEGYTKARNTMKVNGFLGSLVNGPKVLNEYSYNFLLFGSPSSTEPWGWSFYGHHLCMSVYIHGRHIAIAPVFVGAEPNEIDDGPNKGITMLRREESLGLQLMKSLPDSDKKIAVIYQQMHDDRMPPGRWNEADQRHLCGAFQDNRQVPNEGVCASHFGSTQIDILLNLIEEFIIYLPSNARKCRIEQIRNHLDETYFSWVGGYAENDVFYYRIQSPVLALEFDHHSGVFLGNQQPAKYHIHTIARMPNGGDYGNAVRSPEHRLE